MLLMAAKQVGAVVVVSREKRLVLDIKTRQWLQGSFQKKYIR
jgi:hypothetical protein